MSGCGSIFMTVSSPSLRLTAVYRANSAVVWIWVAKDFLWMCVLAGNA